MKAFVCDEYGPPSVLKLKEIEEPVPRTDQVLVKVQAVCVNDWDWALMRGTPFVNRLQAGITKPKKIRIFGSDIAGIVKAVGKDTAQFKPGDRVYGDLTEHWGGFAEYICATENQLAPIPEDMSFVQAASIPQAGMLAVQGLIDCGKLQKGQTLLINGAGGGVGTFGIQIARTIGVEATGVDSTEKLELMKEAGYSHVIDYTKEDFTRNGKRYDLILDNKTNRPAVSYLRSLNPGGAYVSTGGKIRYLLQVITLGSVAALLAGKKMRLVYLRPNKDLAYLNGLFESNHLKPVIDGPYPFNELPKAMERFENGNHLGKIVLTLESA